MTNSIELKPCPFCGGVAEIYRDNLTEIWIVGCDRIKNNCNVVPYATGDTSKDAAAAWNRRVNHAK